MVVEYIRYLLPTDSRTAFLDAYAKAAVALQESEFCLGYELTQCEEEPERFILRIEWSSTQDHLGGFRSSDQFRAFLPHVRPFIDHIEEMQHYSLTDIHGPGGHPGRISP